MVKLEDGDVPLVRTVMNELIEISKELLSCLEFSNGVALKDFNTLLTRYSALVSDEPISIKDSGYSLFEATALAHEVRQGLCEMTGVIGINKAIPRLKFAE